MIGFHGGTGCRSSGGHDGRCCHWVQQLGGEVPDSRSGLSHFTLLEMMLLKDVQLEERLAEIRPACIVAVDVHVAAYRGVIIDRRIRGVHARH